MLAQDEKSIYGKILKINKRELLKNDNEKIQYEIFSMGHRNPQGLVKINDKIYSSEHGPQGGDEINLIKEKGNYGWPLESYGTRYGDGESFNKKETEKIFVRPIFSFLPSIAPSSLGKCPKNLSNFYKSNICLISLSLREQSLFVILLEKENNRIQNIEKIKLSNRMRHFGTKSNGDIFFDDNSFFVSTDDLTILEIKFINFR
jgi:glucose/arabinose dehydrogenase